MTQVGKCCQLSNRTCHGCIIAHTYDNAYPLDDGTERPSSTTKCSSLSVWMEGFCRVRRPFSGTDGGLRRSRPGEGDEGEHAAGSFRVPQLPRRCHLAP